MLEPILSSPYGLGLLGSPQWWYLKHFLLQVIKLVIAFLIQSQMKEVFRLEKV